MQFNGHSDNLDLISEVTFLTGQDTNGFPLKDRTRCINERFRMVWQAIFESYGGWQFMDDNVSDTSTGIPYADQTITSGTSLYALPSGALTVIGVEIKNSGGSWERLSPMTREEFLQAGGDGTFTSSGVPSHYMLQGDVLRLIDTPNYTQAASIRVFFDQGISAFASTDTTKVPGFAEPFHRILAIGAALDYAISHGQPDKAAEYRALWMEYEDRLRKFYGKRWKDRFPHVIRGRDLVREFQ